MVYKGFILLADISGYTRFLRETELEHAQGILGDLLKAMLDRLNLPLVLSSVRGDAIVAHAPETHITDGELFLEAAEGLYMAFKERIEHMIRNTTCRCAACDKIATLNLKMIVHYGEYVVQDLAGRPELHGSDVVKAFRLLKNDIIRKTGIHAYAAYTEDAALKLHVPAWFQKQSEFEQNTEEFGLLRLHISDMQVLWDAYAAQYRVFVEPDDPMTFPEVIQPCEAPKELLWTLSASPTHRALWFPLVETTEMDTSTGRRGVGAKFHCAHSEGPPTIYTIVDNRPFAYCTFDVHLPMGGAMRATLQVEDAEEGPGSVIRVRVARVTAGNFVTRFLLRMIVGMQAKKARKSWSDGFDTLARLAEGTFEKWEEPVSPTALTEEDMASFFGRLFQQGNAHATA